MWEFPPIQLFINAHAVLIGMILIGSFLSVFCGTIFYRSITLNTKESDKEFFINIAVGIVGFGLLLLGFWSLVSSYRQTANCRNLDLNQVKAAQIRKMTDEKTFTGATLRYEDSNKIREVLRSMKNANSTSRRKNDKKSEKYTLGFQVQLILEDDSAGATLYYFYESDQSKQLNVIIPQCTASSNATLNTNSIYNSTTFGDWIRDEIVPQFKTAQ